jgi:hypothetical protein
MVQNIRRKDTGANEGLYILETVFDQRQRREVLMWRTFVLQPHDTASNGVDGLCWG